MSVWFLFLVMLMCCLVVVLVVVVVYCVFFDVLCVEGVLECFGFFVDKSGGVYLIYVDDFVVVQVIVVCDLVSISGGWDIIIYEWQVF